MSCVALKLNFFFGIFALMFKYNTMSKDFHFGISSWSYPWSIGVNKGPHPQQKMTALELLQNAVSLKVGLVQIADNLPLEHLSSSEIEELAHYASAYNLKIEVGTKGTVPELLLKFLEIAKTLKSPLLRTLPALFGKKAVLDEVEQNIRAVLPRFEKAGVVIVLENTEAFHANEYVKLMERIDSPYFRMCLDLANALGIMEGPEYVMDRLIPYCGNYHFKDVEVTRSQTLMGFTIHGKPSGKGQIPLQEVLNVLKARGLHPSVIIELWPPFQENLDLTIQLEKEWIKQSVNYMRNVPGL